MTASFHCRHDDWVRTTVTLDPDVECSHVESWLDQPMAQLLDADNADIRRALELLRRAGAGGNLTTDVLK